MKKLCGDFDSLQSICLVSKHGYVSQERFDGLALTSSAPHAARRALAADGNVILARAAARSARGRLKRKSYCLLEKRLITVKLSWLFHLHPPGLKNTEEHVIIIQSTV